MTQLTHLSLFSGIGGIDLAADAAGFTTVAFSEIEPFAQQVLRKHWPDVPIIPDVRDVTRKRLGELGVVPSEAEYGVTILSGGFP